MRTNQIRQTLLSIAVATATLTAPPVFSDAKSGKEIAPIKPDVPYIFVVHNGRSVRIERDVNDSFRARSTIRGALSINSTACPPFCLQPLQLEIPVQTIAEAELIDFMLTDLRDDNGLIIDVRNKNSYQVATIPGSIHYYVRDIQKGPGDKDFEQMLERFGAKRHDGLTITDKLTNLLELDGHGMKTDNWDFSEAKTLVFWNGSAIDPTAARAIQVMYEAGYPAEKLKWYRGGLASWQYWGFNTFKTRK